VAKNWFRYSDDIRSEALIRSSAARAISRDGGKAARQEITVAGEPRSVFAEDQSRAWSLLKSARYGKLMMLSYAPLTTRCSK
jgi:hypothetical protein